MGKVIYIKSRSERAQGKAIARADWLRKVCAFDDPLFRSLSQDFRTGYAEQWFELDRLEAEK